MAHTYTNLLTHAVFSTKERLPLLTGDLYREMHAYLGGIVRGEGHRALIVGGTADHVHLLLLLRPAVAVADLMRLMKSNSSDWASSRFGRAFRWQVEYGAFTVSHREKGEIETYIANQAAHHRVVGFQEEYLRLLKENGVDYNPTHLWD